MATCIDPCLQIRREPVKPPASAVADFSIESALKVKREATARRPAGGVTVAAAKNGKAPSPRPDPRPSAPWAAPFQAIAQPFQTPEFVEGGGGGGGADLGVGEVQRAATNRALTASFLSPGGGLAADSSVPAPPPPPAEDSFPFLSISCTQRPKKPAAAEVSDDPLVRTMSKSKAQSAAAKPKMKSPAPPGISQSSPAIEYLMYTDAPEPGMPAPDSPVPFLAKRYTDRDMRSLANEHEGRPEPLLGPAAQVAAEAHVKDGWKPANVDKFLHNEALCQAVFGFDWDPRYGRSRVRSSTTGELLCWGDGDSYFDDGVNAKAGLSLDGAELSRRLKEERAAPALPAATKGRHHMVGHPMGDSVAKAGSGYYRWLANDPRGVDVRDL